MGSVEKFMLSLPDVGEIVEDRAEVTYAKGLSLVEGEYGYTLMRGRKAAAGAGLGSRGARER